MTSPNEAETTTDPTAVTIAAYAAGETMTVTAPAEWADRIRALEAVTTYGPAYQRRVVDTLHDLSHTVRSGYLELALSKLEYCERIAAS